MAHYAGDDLSDDWEFKIVRSNTGIFRKPEQFAKLLEEEARFGWIMLEKLDNSRVRFKRRRGERPRDAAAVEGQDPYRTYYGTSPSRTMAVAILFGLLFAGITLVVMLLILGRL